MTMHTPPANPRPAVNLPLGRLLSTPGAIDALSNAGQDGSQLLERHRRGDWCELTPEDKALNDCAVVDGDRILSAYILGTGTKVWIITEADRSATTILLPDEY
jgi:hypothetical protein